MSWKNLLLASFSELLENYSMEEITVKKILEHSGASRSTFYRNFRDKYDLMNQHYLYFFEKAANEHQDKTWEEAVLAIMTYLYEHRRYYLNAFQTEGQNCCYDYLYHDNVKRIINRLARVNGITTLSTYELAAVYFYSAGKLQVIKRWIKGELQATPEEITQILLDIMPKFLNDMFVKYKPGSSD